MEIQHAAGWTSNKQLKTYDYSEQDDAFNIQLAKRGLIDEPQYNQYHPEAIRCEYCQTMNGFTEKYCTHCKHQLHKKNIKQEIQRNEQKDNFIKWIKTDPEINQMIQTKIHIKNHNLKTPIYKTATTE